MGESQGKLKRAVASKQSKAGLTFSVARVDKKLRHSKLAKQVAGKASVYLTGVVEHVILKIVDEAGAHAAMKKSRRIMDHDIIAAVRSDPDVARAFSGFAFASTEKVPKAIDRILSEEDQKARRERKEAAAALKKQAVAGAEGDDRPREAADEVED